MKRAKDYRESAWKALTGRYWWAVLAGVIASILGGAGAASVPSVSPQLTQKIGAGELSRITETIPQEVLTVIGIVTAAVLTVAVTVGLALFVIGGAVELGYNMFNIKLFTTNDRHDISDIFSRFSIFGKALWLRVLIGLKVFAWMLLFIIPGIIAAYRYALAPYILAEHPEMTAKEAIEESKRLMAGNKWRLFCLELSFIGWALLAGLTLGIGVIFLAPYQKAAHTSFYMDLSRNDPAKQGQEPESCFESYGDSAEAL